MQDFWKISLEEAKARLSGEARQRFTVMLRHGSMQVEYFAPEKIDTQTPHRQDELYLVASGTAEFFRDDDSVKCKAGDVLFVPAGMEHRFKNFSADFATWVIFYGPDGGEQGL
jgi:mannose-6-phosphate isomerase-like protein (cupin superfamily)